MRIENFSPLDPIKHVLLGAPGTEAVFGSLLHPKFSLFESNAPTAASVVAAYEDHHRMQSELATRGIEVFNMRKILGEVLTKRSQNHRFSTPKLFLEELRNRAYLLQLRYRMPGDIENKIEELEKLIELDIAEMGFDAAIAINGVLTNILDLEGRERPFDPEILPPIANFLFWRDTNHITGDKMGVHTMHYLIRDQEVQLARLGFEALGIEYQAVRVPSEVKKDKDGIPINTLSIEGGDVLPFELNNQLYALIGQAERTSWAAVQAWYELHESTFNGSGAGVIPAVVEGPSEGTQDQMHLDTFAQQIAPGVLIHCGEITGNRDFSLLMRKGGEIVKVKPENLSTGTFREWIEQQATDAYDMTEAEQLAYAPNVLVHGSESGATTVFVTRDGTEAVTEFIKKHAAETVLLQMNDLTTFYGGAHCATSEIR